MQINTLINKRIFILSLVTFFFMCCSFREPKWCKLSDRVVKAYLNEFVKPRELVLNGFGGAFVYDVKKVTLNFLSFETMNVDESRVLYVEMMEEFLRRMNQDEKVRPYLHNYPFEIDNYELMISFVDGKAQTIADGHVALLYIGRDHELCFRAYDSQTEKFYHLHREPYEESARIVKGTN